MNGIYFTCNGVSNVINFPGVSGNWQTEKSSCDGGFSGMMVKFEKKANLFANL